MQLETQDPKIANIRNALTSFNVDPQQTKSSGSYLVAQILDDDIHVSNNQRKVIYPPM